MTNLGYIYYKEYFNNLDLRKFSDDSKAKKITKHNNNELKEINRTLFDTELKDQNYYSSFSSLGLKNIELTTIYPGLLIGSGYIHEIGGLENELKLGFFFDHTTGLPILPGSSVKGVLRSAFEKADGEYVKELLTDTEGVNPENIDVHKLEKSIFDGEEDTSVYKRDIFFDAFPTGTVGSEKFLDNDYITPHPDPLKDPKPIQFLKILPQVQFQFNFKLEDYVVDETIIFSAEQKKQLFKLILLDLGIGAKTNVGYGQFVDPDNKQTSNTATTTNGNIEVSKPREKSNAEKKLIDKAELDCVVSKTDKTYFYIKFDWDEKLEFRKKLSKIKKTVTENDQIKIRIVSNYDDGVEILNFQVI